MKNIFHVHLLPQVSLYSPTHYSGYMKWLYYEKSFKCREMLGAVPRLHIALGPITTLSKTTKLILLDSLLQEVCISSAMMGRSP